LRGLRSFPTRRSSDLGRRGRRPDVGVRRGTLGQALAAQEALAFQGRAAELARVWRLLGAPARLPRIVRIHGPPGIGKTAFAYAQIRRAPVLTPGPHQY